ncbi:MAG TPA: prepilin-type N-terminal cleavage/methylation domain-containing protein [Gemmatimonadaceae bacterium]
MRSRARPGFSLLELFLALVVIGILVGLAIPRFRAYERKVYIAAMVDELRDLAVREESYRRGVGAYTSDVSVLGFVASPGVTVTVVRADSAGWSARAIHGQSAATCAISYGTAPVLPPATVKNFVGCAR